jgi:hypothetical protein
VKGQEIIIPELEEEVKRNHGKTVNGGGLNWTEKEEKILKRYYGKVNLYILMKHLPGRTRSSVSSKARTMGIQDHTRRSQ